MVEEGSGKGVQFYSTTQSLTINGSDYFNGELTYGNCYTKYTKIKDLPFEPTIMIVAKDYQHWTLFVNSTLGLTNIPFAIMFQPNDYDECMEQDGNVASFEGTINYSNFKFPLTSSINATTANYSIMAFGVGEEDTTLRDSLASILENKGVDVTEEDDMASLINKVSTVSSTLSAGDTRILASNSGYSWNLSGSTKAIQTYYMILPGTVKITCEESFNNTGLKTNNYISVKDNISGTTQKLSCNSSTGSYVFDNITVTSDTTITYYVGNSEFNYVITISADVN
jgi:hypothetical protein